jgi:hypothetical protein
MPELSAPTDSGFDDAMCCRLCEMRGSSGEVTEFDDEDRYGGLMRITTASEPHFQRLA